MGFEGDNMANTFMALTVGGAILAQFHGKTAVSEAE
jgi:hypothetical protein